MAEYAQRYIEEMLPEVDKMRKIGLFSTEETRAIMKKRKRFEYKTQRRTKEREVYLQYIQYEIGVQQLVKIRREKRGIEIEKDKIDKPIALRIYRLFRAACFRFKHDVKLWLTYIDFAKKNHDKERVSKLFTTMLKVHNKKSNLWIMAAKFEFEINESVETARNLFQRALRLLPDKTKIWIEYFKMELMCVDLIMKRKELLGLNEIDDENENKNTKNDGEFNPVSTDKKIEDSILSCKIVEIVFINAVKRLKDNTEEIEKMHQNIPDLVHKLIKIANEFQFTESLIDRMYKFIEDDSNLNKFEESWNVLSRRNLLKEESILKKCEESGQCADFTIAEFEDKTNACFIKACEDLDTEKMHHIYLEFCIERLKLNSKFLNDERFTRLNEAFLKAQSKYGLPLSYLIEWIEILIQFKKYEEATSQIEQNGLKKHIQSVFIWKLYLTIKMEKTNELNQNEIIEIFHKAISNINLKESLDLWETIINWCLLSNHESTELILKEGSQVMHKEISSFCRLKYLNWSLQSSNQNVLEKFRKIYESLRQVPPYSVDLYHKYIEIEKCAAKLDKNKIVGAYEDALIHFAKDDLDLWIAYINFMYSQSNKSDLSAVSTIYWRAMKHLNTELIDLFTQKYCLFKINLDDEKLNTSPDDYDIEMDKE